jgi:hypothetical protein
MKFKDSNGKEWTIKIDGYVLCTYEDETGVSLFESIAKNGLSGPVPSMKNLYTLLYIACRVSESGMSKEDFMSALYGDSFDCAIIAMTNALCSFSPTLRTLGTSLLAVVERFGVTNLVLGAEGTFSNTEQSQA